MDLCKHCSNKDISPEAHDAIIPFITVGVPDAPMLSNIQQSTHSNNNGLMFNFDVFQSGIAASCVFKYKVMFTGTGCNYTHSKLVDATQLNTYNTMAFGALPVCCEEYNVTVSGVDRSNRESTPSIGQHIVDFSGMCVCVYACMYLCMYVRMYVCMYVCVCILYICMYVCMNAGI